MVEGMKTLNLPIVQHVRKDYIPFNPSMPDDWRTFHWNDGPCIDIVKPDGNWAGCFPVTYINDLRHENDERTQGVHCPVVEGYDMPHLSTTAICLSFAITAFFPRKSRILLALPWESELDFFLPKIFLLFKKCVHLTLVCKKTTWICDFSKANKSRVYF